jgi:hypothetical protein
LDDAKRHAGGTPLALLRVFQMAGARPRHSPASRRLACKAKRHWWTSHPCHPAFLT